jgi:Rrf2 family cysteine metabolism transcriptional repressor
LSLSGSTTRATFGDGRSAVRLTARSEYGLLALIDLACRAGQGPVSARGVAERQRIPGKFLEQLFASLRKAGLVTAVRGAHGGFELSRAASAITVLDVVEALEGPLRPTLCGGEVACERGGACAAADVWGRATSALRDVFGTTTLAALAGAQTAIDEDGGQPVAAESTGGAKHDG